MSEPLCDHTLSGLGGCVYVLGHEGRCSYAHEWGLANASAPRVTDLVRQAATIMRASKRGEVQIHVADGDGWIVLTLPEHRPAPEGPVLEYDVLARGSASAPEKLADPVAVSGDAHGIILGLRLVANEIALLSRTMEKRR